MPGHNNVGKRWRSPAMALRWTAVVMLRCLFSIVERNSWYWISIQLFLKEIADITSQSSYC
jgi:hypothetical protein